MVRALPALAIAGAVATVLAAVVLAEWTLALVPLLALVAAVFLFLERTPMSMAAGAVVAALAVVAVLGVLGSVNIKGRDTGFGVDADVGTALAISSGVAIVAGATLAAWGRIAPPVGALAFVAAGLALVLSLAWRDGLADHSGWRAMLLAVLGLAALVPAVALVKAGTPQAGGSRAPAAPAKAKPEPPKRA